MKFMRTAAFLATVLLAGNAAAHDPEQFDRLFGREAPRPVPTTCEGLSDPVSYNLDASNPAVLELFKRCDAKAKAQQAAAAKQKPSAAKPKKPVVATSRVPVAAKR